MALNAENIELAAGESASTNAPHAAQLAVEILYGNLTGRGLSYEDVHRLSISVQQQEPA